MSSTFFVRPTPPVGRSATRRLAGPLLLVGAANMWIGAVVDVTQQTGSVGYGLLEGSLGVLLYGVIGIPIIALALLPPALGTFALLARGGNDSVAARSLAGAATWAAWAAMLWLATQAAPLESRAPAGSALLVVAVGAIEGGAFAIVALRPPLSAPGRLLNVAAITLVLFVAGGTLISAIRNAASP